MRGLLRRWDTVEQRVVLLRATSIDDAIARGLQEFEEYAELLNYEFGGHVQVYAADGHGDGAEVFSLVHPATVGLDSLERSLLGPLPLDTSVVGVSYDRRHVSRRARACAVLRDLVGWSSD